AADRAAKAAETSAAPSVPLPPSTTCSTCKKRRPVTDFSLKNPLGDTDGERYRVCAPCTVKRHIRRPLKRNIVQVGQQDDEPPPARRQRLSAVPTERARATGTEETPAIDFTTRCSGCMKWLPLSDFPRRSDGLRDRRCERCKRQEHPEQLGEQDADGHLETPAIDSVPKRFCTGCNRKLPLGEFLKIKNNKILRTCVRCRIRQQKRRPPHKAQENVAGQDNTAPPPITPARRSMAQINADRAAEDRRRTANVEKALASALRAAEANARRTSPIALSVRGCLAGC
ncbi:hypothetical protein E4U33_005559, partial [Claviceps sp. LM78 group G4]